MIHAEGAAPVLGGFGPLCVESPSRRSREHEYEPRLTPEDEDEDDDEDEFQADMKLRLF